MKMEQTECSEKSVYKIQTPGNYPEESIQQIVYFYWNSFTKLSFFLSQKTIKNIIHDNQQSTHINKSADNRNSYNLCYRNDTAYIVKSE